MTQAEPEFVPQSPRREKPERGPKSRRWRWIGALFVAAVGANLAINGSIAFATRSSIYSSVEAVPARPVAIVFGAGIVGRFPSDVLRDRVETAAALYRAGKVRKLLMTGDNSRDDYNEVAVMKRVAIGLGVPGRDIVLDHAGFRTYDSCYRARDVFEVRGAVLVTQAFHLPRAVYIARRLGIDAVGIEADKQEYLLAGKYALREWLASRPWAWAQVNLLHSRPHFLGPKIPVMEAPSSSGDPGR